MSSMNITKANIPMKFTIVLLL